MRLIVKYGIQDNSQDITAMCYYKCLHGSNLIIPRGEVVRTNMFGDPVMFSEKSIFLYDGDYNLLRQFRAHEHVFFPMNEHKIELDDVIHPLLRLFSLESSLKLGYGSFNDQFEVQLMSFNFIKPESQVLEFNTQNGINSLIVGSIVSNPKQLVVMTDSESFDPAKSNRDLNGQIFEIHPMDSPNINFSKMLNELETEFTTLITNTAIFYKKLGWIGLIIHSVKTIILQKTCINPERNLVIEAVLSDNNFKQVYSKNAGLDVDIPCKKDYYVVLERV